MWYNEIIKAIIYSGLVLLVINIFNINPNFNLNKENEVLNHKIDSLNNVIELSNVKIKNYTLKIDSLTGTLKELDNELNQNKTKLTKLKKDYEKKLTSIDNASTNELVQFFSERYK